MNAPHFQRGLSTIELLVGMALGLLVMSGAVKVVSDVLARQEQLNQQQQLIESARLGLRLLQEDIRRAGEWAGYVPAYDDALTTTLPDGYPADFQSPLPCQLPTQWTAQQTRNLVRMPVQSFSGVPAGCESVVQNLMPGSAVFVVRFLDTNAALCETGRVLFQPSECAAVSAQTHRLGRSGFDLRATDCQRLAPCYRYLTRLYFVRNDRSLMRVELNSNGASWSVQPLVEHIAHLQVTLGLDNRGSDGQSNRYQQAPVWPTEVRHGSPYGRGDGVVDSWQTCPTNGCSIAQLMDVSAVRLQLTAQEGAHRFSSSVQTNLPAVLARRVLP